MTGKNGLAEYTPPRRSRNLSDADITAISEALKGHAICNMGLTADEVSTLKRFLAAFDKAAGIVGKMILTVLVAAAIAMFTKGFWVSLASGIKQGAPK
jgi:hypothetical protein